MPARIQAVATHSFSVPAERVYDAWLDPQIVRRWMAAALQTFGLAGDIQRIEIDARVGGKFFFSDLRDGQEARHWGTYLELDRPRKIVFTWMVDESEAHDPSRVTLTIEPAGQGCTATIVHEMDARWADYVARTQQGWGRMLAAIDTLGP
ncbi:MAG: SRPBCC family protein [Pirellulales bacterium]